MTSRGDAAFGQVIRLTCVLSVPLAMAPFVAATWIGDARAFVPYTAMLLAMGGCSAATVLAWWRTRSRYPGWAAGPPEAAAGTLLALAAVMAFLTYPDGDYVRGIDAARRWLSGGLLYVQDGTTHPPLMPLIAAGGLKLAARLGTWWSLPGGSAEHAFYVTHQLWQFMLLAALTWLLYALARAAGARPTRASVLVAVLVLACHPLRDALGHNQVSVPVLVLGLAATWLGDRRPLMAGMLAGVGALLKLYPAALAAYWIAARRWRVAAGAAVIVLSAVLVTAEETRAWLAYLLSVGRAPHYRDPSLHGTLSNLAMAAGARQGIADAVRLQLGLWSWLAAVIAIGGWSLHMSRRRAASGSPHDRLIAETTLLGAAVLCFPLAWSHHYIFLLPLAVLRVSGPGDVSRLVWLGVLLALVAPAADVFPLGVHRLAGAACLIWAPWPAVVRNGPGGDNGSDPWV